MKYIVDGEHLFSEPYEVVDYIAENGDFRESYEDILDELSPVKVGNIEFDASRILENLDPIAYRVGLNDFIDSEGEDIRYAISEMCEGETEEFYGIMVEAEHMYD